MEKRIYIVLLTGLMMVSCSPRALHEAQRVVAEADSLRAEGRMYDDSLALAQAYGTLGHWQWFYADDYAHACYHYGRLLREKDNPVEAMQCFINASHAPTRDYHILGRVYSNIGDIAHLAGEFALAYDMYERSGSMYLCNGDTLLYYYDLYRMAYELAEQGKKDSCFAITENIKSRYQEDSTLIAYCYMSQAQACFRCQQYDSLLCYSRQAKYYLPSLSSVSLQLAQAYSLLGEKDSATYYAEQVLSQTNSLLERNNALYILTNDDQTKDLSAVRQAAADRSDTQKLLEIRQGKLSQAVQLLQQDLDRKPNLWWLYSILGTLVVVGTGIFIYVYRKRKKQELFTQQIDVLEQTASSIREMNNMLAARYHTEHQRIESEINSRCSVLQTNDEIRKKLAWKNYKTMCSAVDKQFYLLASKLRSKQCLNETEIRLCVLTLLDCGYDQMAELLFRSTTSIGTLKTRVAKKLGTSSKNLRQYLIDNECLK